MKRYKKLSLDDIQKIEKVYNYNFSEKYKNFLYKRFFIFEEGYDWKDFSEDNIKKIKTLITDPIEYIKEDIREVEWNDRWGLEPEDYEEKKERINILLESAPKLFPVFSHRYIPVIDHENPPVLSIHGLDIIYYGKNYKSYIRNENSNAFLSEHFSLEKYPYVPFWTDLM